MHPRHRCAAAALYPDDRATGFEVGDLRGMFRVTLDTATLTAQNQ